MKWKKPKKNILFHSKLFLSTFWWKRNFLNITSAELSSLRLIWYRCCNLCLMTGNTSYLVWQGVSNIFTMLNYFIHLTNFKQFGSSTCSHVHIQSHDTCGQHKAGDLIWTCEHVEDPKRLKFVRHFCFYSASTKTSFGFCSCSELLQLKFREKNVAGKYKLPSPQYSYRGI